MVSPRSSAASTSSVSTSTIKRPTKAPTEPCSRTTPLVAPISWLTSTVAVPSPLSKAPMPSGMPTKRQAVPSGLVAPITSSPALMIEVKPTPGAVGTRYGVSGVEGPTEEVAMCRIRLLFPCRGATERAQARRWAGAPSTLRRARNSGAPTGTTTVLGKLREALKTAARPCPPPVGNRRRDPVQGHHCPPSAARQGAPRGDLDLGCQLVTDDKPLEAMAAHPTLMAGPSS